MSVLLQLLALPHAHNFLKRKKNKKNISLLADIRSADKHTDCEFTFHALFLVCQII